MLKFATLLSFCCLLRYENCILLDIEHSLIGNDYKTHFFSWSEQCNYSGTYSKFGGFIDLTQWLHQSLKYMVWQLVVLVLKKSVKTLKPINFEQCCTVCLSLRHLIVQTQTLYKNRVDTILMQCLNLSYQIAAIDIYRSASFEKYWLEFFNPFRNSYSF